MKKISNLKIYLYIFLVILFSLVFVVVRPKQIDETQQKIVKPIVKSFEECLKANNQVMESHPRRCKAGEEIFTENIGNELEKQNLIRLDNPRPNQEIQSPFTIEGEARGVWFFEASFPVVLVDWDGLIIAQTIATAQSDWMTNDFVKFKAEIKFDKPAYSNKGALILKKDNPLGLPQYDDALEIPIIFK
jgi:hypothetical protein